MNTYPTWKISLGCHRSQQSACLRKQKENEYILKYRYTYFDIHRKNCFQIKSRTHIFELAFTREHFSSESFSVYFPIINL